MSLTEYFSEKIPRYPLVVAAMLIIAVVAIATALLQAIRVIDVLANMTEVWLFFAVFPLLSLAAAFIAKELGKRDTLQSLMDKEEGPIIRDMRITTDRMYRKIGHLTELDYMKEMLMKDLSTLPETVQNDRKQILKVLEIRKDVIGRP